MYRVEDKYERTELEMIALQRRLEKVLKADSNQQNEYGYVITSLYFDDLFDTNLKETVEGIDIRQKYRIRIYNHSLNTIKCEVKFKKYNRIMKKSKTISVDTMNDLMRGKAVHINMYSADDPVCLFNLAIMQRGLRPKVIVEYDRKAYINESGNVRITLDRNLRYSNNIGSFGKEHTGCKNIKNIGHVLEVKYDEFLPQHIAQLLELNNMNQISYSKYKLCRQAGQMCYR